MPDHSIDLTEATQNGCDQQARERTIARRQFGHAGVVFNRFIEGMPLPQHCADEIERCASCSDGGSHAANGRKTLHLRKLAPMWQGFNSPQHS
jgi:hypothetical protein